MAELTLTEITERLSIHRDEYGEKIGEAIQELVGALGVSDFLKKVRQKADTLFRNDTLMRYMADLLQRGFEERQLSDYDLYVNPRGIPLNGAGSEIFVLFPNPTGRVINHPGRAVGHYYGQGEICGHEGEVFLHGTMRADMDGKSRLNLFGQSRAKVGGHAEIELFDRSRVNPRDSVSVRMHDFSSAFLMEKGSACEIEADGSSHLIAEEGRHNVKLSGDVLFMDLTDSDVQINDRCSGYKPKGNIEKGLTALGLVWTDNDLPIEVDFRNRIHSRRCMEDKSTRQCADIPGRIDQARELIGAYARRALLPEEYHVMLSHVSSMESMAGLLSVYLDDLLEQGLRMDEVKRLFLPSELSGAHIYTGTEAVPQNMEGRYHVFDHLIVPQTSDRAYGIFHDHSIGVIKSGFSKSLDMALTEGEGTSILKAAGHSTLLLRDASKGVAEEESLGIATDHAQIKAKGYSIIEARENATVNGKGHSITKLHEDSVGFFSEQASFMAKDNSRYALADEAKGVALPGVKGSLPASLNDGKEVPTVTEQEGREFYTTCLQDRGNALAAEIRKEESNKMKRAR